MNNDGMCQKCRKRASCKTPCAFVDEILKQDNRPQFHEVNARGLNGEAITVCMSHNHRHEVNESNLDYMHAVDTDGEGWESDDKKTPFTTEADSPWADYQPTLNQTTIFIKRLLQGMSYEDIADELELSVDLVRSYYHSAKNRMIEALQFADSRNKTIAFWENTQKRSEKVTGKLPKYMKWMLMHKVFDLSIQEITELEGAGKNDAASKIRWAYDRLVTGEYVLLDPTPEQIEAARQRIEKKRARDRRARAA